MQGWLHTCTSRWASGWGWLRYVLIPFSMANLRRSNRTASPDLQLGKGLNGPNWNDKRWTSISQHRNPYLAVSELEFCSLAGNISRRSIKELLFKSSASYKVNVVAWIIDLSKMETMRVSCVISKSASSLQAMSLLTWASLECLLTCAHCPLL